MNYLDKVLSVDLGGVAKKKPVDASRKIVLPRTKSVLDSIDMRKRINDSSEKKETQKTRLVILDSAKIMRLFSLPVKKRERLLSELSDSQREEVMQMYRRLRLSDSRRVRDEFDDIYEDELYDNEEIFEDGDDIYGDLYGDDIYDDPYDDVALLGGYDVDPEPMPEPTPEPQPEPTPEPVQEPEPVPTPEPVPVEEAAMREGVAPIIAVYMKDFSFREALNAIEDLALSFVTKGCDYAEAYDSAMTIFDSCIKEKSEEVFKAHDKQVRDSVIDDIANSLGDTTPEGSSPLEMLNNALEDFINGDSTALKMLAEGSGNKEGDDNIEKEGDDNANQEGDEPPIEDSVKVGRFALSVLNGVPDNALMEQLQSSVPFLRDHDMRMCDYHLYNKDMKPVEGVPQPPLTCAEFHTLYNPSEVFTVAKEIGQKAQCVPIKTFGVEGDLVAVNPEGLKQLFVPMGGHSAARCCAEMESMDEKGRGEYIMAQCVPLPDLYKASVLCNQLGFIDSDFYKKRFSDTCWTFDNTPQTIKDIVGECEAGSTVYPTSDIPAVVPSSQSKQLLICGVPYTIFPPK